MQKMVPLLKASAVVSVHHYGVTRDDIIGHFLLTTESVFERNIPSFYGHILSFISSLFCCFLKYIVISGPIDTKKKLLRRC